MSKTTETRCRYGSMQARHMQQNIKHMSIPTSFLSLLQRIYQTFTPTKIRQIEVFSATRKKYVGMNLVLLHAIIPAYCHTYTLFLWFLTWPLHSERYEELARIICAQD